MTAAHLGPGNAEQQRLQQINEGQADWHLWGPYLAERAWGTVREDYSADAQAWDDFSFAQAHARAYRWSEDGLGGFSDRDQRLCFALGLWNEQDPILKERAFGLTNAQGNRGEEVKEYYFHVDATPSHSWMRYLYKYPQQPFPYKKIIAENARRQRDQAPFGLIDTGIFDRGYWDVAVTYARRTPKDLFIRITATNCGPETSTLHLLPRLWFRNTWAWKQNSAIPKLERVPTEKDQPWQIIASHPHLGDYRFSGRQSAQLLFSDNESNSALLWDEPGPRYTKDAFARFLIDGESDAVRPEQFGTQFAAARRIDADAGQSVQFDLRLCAADLPPGFDGMQRLLVQRRTEADVFYDELQPGATTEDHRILRQSLAGMVWGKQFYHYDVSRWLEGDQIQPPAERLGGRNSNWRHMRAHDIISMPDSWEYPWFAAWDLAYQCGPFALIDTSFAKKQIELLLSERYLHPTGQIPAYEWNFNDSNPPVHAAFALRLFRADQRQGRAPDHAFLRRVFNKLILNFAWWLNRKDSDGQNLFEGGFLGLDNISVFDRSKSALPPGYKLKQADATGWMAMYALNMTVMSLELSTIDRSYLPMAVQCYEQFLAIAESIIGQDHAGVSLWDKQDGFFKDIVVGPSGDVHRVDVFSWVGLIPLFATEFITPQQLDAVPEFAQLLAQHRDSKRHGHYAGHGNRENGFLLSLVNRDMLKAILTRVMDEDQFLSPFGIRSLSKQHNQDRVIGNIPGIGPVHIEYVPGEADSPMYGGNSNWRGPVWLPTNYSLILAMERFHRFLGKEFVFDAPVTGQPINLAQAVELISSRVVDLYRRNEQGAIPAMRTDSPFQSDANWKDYNLFYEYFHAETGRGLGAAHQTGWTGLLANLVMRGYARPDS